MNVTGNIDDISAETVPSVRTVGELIDVYQTDPVSSYKRLRYQVRRNQSNLLKRLKAQAGQIELAAVKARDLKAWHLRPRWSRSRRCHE